MEMTLEDLKMLKYCCNKINGEIEDAEKNLTDSIDVDDGFFINPETIVRDYYLVTINIASMKSAVNAMNKIVTDKLAEALKNGKADAEG